MNDICSTSKILSFILFADDTTVFHSDTDITKLLRIMNEELVEIVNWFRCNKLSLNAAKTNFMILGTPHQTKNIIHDTQIILDGCKLVRVNSAKFLGITIDENITWKPHIDNVSKICSKNIGVLNKLKCYLPKSSLYKLYCTLILPYLSYGIILWGSANKDCLNRILKLQKRAVRIISDSSYLCHTKPLFERFNMLNIENLFKKECCIFMYKYNNGMLPKVFDNMFTDMKSIHDYDTRNKDSLRPEIHKVTNIITIGPKVWNSLPKNIKAVKNISAFKKGVINLLKHVD